MNWFLIALKKYATFWNRAQRAEILVFRSFLHPYFHRPFSHRRYPQGRLAPSGHGVTWGHLTLALLIPSIAVGVRRLHDTSRSGWWLLIALIPLIGAIVLLVFTVQDSEASDNAYGPNPKPVPPNKALHRKNPPSLRYGGLHR